MITINMVIICKPCKCCKLLLDHWYV